MQTAAVDFGKTGISKEYDTELMEKKRFGDTMAPVIEVFSSIITLIKLYIQKPKEEKEKKQMPKIKCKFGGIPNRFGIEPG